MAQHTILGPLGSIQLVFVFIKGCMCWTPDIWSGPQSGIHLCVGVFCQAVVHDTASDWAKMGDVFIVAMHQCGGVVASRRATHSSVVAARILEYCFHRNVDDCYAWVPAPSPIECCGQCGPPVGPEDVFAALRTLPKPPDFSLLSMRVFRDD